MKKIPYLIRIFWSDEDRCYIAEIPELKGCSGMGLTPARAIDEAGKSIENWLHVAKNEGISIPKPLGARHAGRLNLRLPEEIVDQVKRAARERQMSMNQYVMWRLAS